MKQYDSYKDSGVEWIGEVPSHWEVVPLKRAITINNGCDYKHVQVEEDGYPVIGSGGQFAWANQYMYDGEAVLLGRKGTIDKPMYYNGKFWTVDTMFYGIPKKNANCKYLYYQAKNIPFERYATATALPSMTQTDLNNNTICLPPLDEQIVIANYLDKKCSEIDNVISAQQKRIALLQELKQSVITHAVTKGLNPNVEMKDSGVEWIGKMPKHWEIYKIKNCCKSEQYSIKTGPFGTQLKGEDLQPQGDVAVYSQQNVINNDFTNIRYFVSFKKAEALKGFYTKPNDVLVTSRGTIGKAAILSSSFSNGILHPCLIALRLKQEICLNDWLVMYINETDCFKTDVSLSSNATTIDVIYTGTLKNIYIPVPPHEEQLKILRSIKIKCSSIDSSISKAQHQVELLQEYKQSLITEVVTGKRRVS